MFPKPICTSFQGKPLDQLISIMTLFLNGCEERVKKEQTLANERSEKLNLRLSKLAPLTSSTSSAFINTSHKKRGLIQSFITFIPLGTRIAPIECDHTFVVDHNQKISQTFIANKNVRFRLLLFRFFFSISNILRNDFFSIFTELQTEKKARL